MEEHPVVEAAARVLDDHDLAYWARGGTRAHCTCGATGPSHGAHLAAVLAEAGLLASDEAGVG